MADPRSPLCAKRSAWRSSSAAGEGESTDAGDGETVGVGDEVEVGASVAVGVADAASVGVAVAMGVAVEVAGKAVGTCVGGAAVGVGVGVLHAVRIVSANKQMANRPRFPICCMYVVLTIACEAPSCLITDTQCAIFVKKSIISL